MKHRFKHFYRKMFVMGTAATLLIRAHVGRYVHSEFNSGALDLNSCSNQLLAEFVNGK